MRFEFYIVEAGEFAAVQVRHLQSANIELATGGSMAEGRAAVEQRFQELVSSNPDIGQIMVVCPTIGDPPGVVVATELVFTAVPTGRTGRRQLAWAMEEGMPI